MTTPSTTPALPFNESDVTQKADNLFNANRTIGNVQNISLSDKTVTVTFSNKNSDGSNQTTEATFTSVDVAEYAKAYLDQKLSNHRSRDTSHCSAPPPALMPRS